MHVMAKLQVLANANSALLLRWHHFIESIRLQVVVFGVLGSTTSIKIKNGTRIYKVA